MKTKIFFLATVILLSKFAFTEPCFAQISFLDKILSEDILNEGLGEAGKQIIEKSVGQAIKETGATYESIDYNLASNTLKIKNLVYKDKIETIYFETSIQDISIEGINLEAFNILAGDYPLVAEKIVYNGLVGKFIDTKENVEINYAIDQQTTLKWQQNLGKLLLAAKEGTNTKKFFERLFTTKVEEIIANNLFVHTLVDGKNEFIFENTTMRFQEGDTLAFFLEDIFIKVKERNRDLGKFSIGKLESTQIPTTPAERLASFSFFLLNGDNKKLEAELSDYLQSADALDLQGGKTIIQDMKLSIAPIDEFLTIKEFVSQNLNQNSNTQLEIKSLRLSQEFFDYLRSPFISENIGLTVFGLNVLDCDFLLNYTFDQDFKNIKFTFGALIQNLFDITLSSDIEFQENLLTAKSPDIKRIEAFVLNYEDLGLIPRINYLMQQLLSLDAPQAQVVMTLGLNELKRDLPEIADALIKIVNNLGSVKITLLQATDIHTLRANIVNANAFAVEHTAGAQNHLDAVKNLEIQEIVHKKSEKRESNLMNSAKNFK